MIGQSGAVRQVSVAFVPFDSGNPYQRQLADHLGRLGVQVETQGSLKELVNRIVRGGESPDLVHLHWLPRVRLGPLGGLRALAFLLRILVVVATGRKIVWTVHNLYSHEVVARRFERLVTMCVVRSASQIIVHSPSAVQLVAREFRVRDHNRIVVIPHGNYIDSYKNCVPRSLARDRLGLPDDSFVYLFFGNIRPYKGVRQLIATFQQMTTRSSVLLLAGRIADKTERVDIERAIGGDPRIRVDAGYISEEDVQLYLNASDVVVFPYLDVLTSGAVILAMSFGRPCVATKAGCIPDVLDQRGAFLYGPGETDGLRLALENASISRERLSAMGAYNMERASRWDWNRVARETRAAYWRALGCREPVAERPSIDGRMTDSAS